MKYLKTITGVIIECKDDNFDTVLLRNQGSIELTEDEAYTFLFVKISNRMGSKFSNYNNIDIASEVLYMLLHKYKTCGVYAPDKNFEDNARIWWSIAKKDCYYLIRQYKQKTKFEDLVDYLPEDAIVSDYYEIESLSTCTALMKYINDLLLSQNNTEQNMGFYGICKLRGLTDKDVAKILKLGMGRIYELKRALKSRLYKQFGDIL